MSGGSDAAVVKGTKDIAPLTAFRDLDKLGLFQNVPTFNFHPHLPHYELTTQDTKSVHLLARQPIDPDRRTRSPQPATRSSTVSLDAAKGAASQNIVLVDSTRTYRSSRRTPEPQ